MLGTWHDRLCVTEKPIRAQIHKARFSQTSRQPGTDAGLATPPGTRVLPIFPPHVLSMWILSSQQDC